MGLRIAITGANGQLGQTLLRSSLCEQHTLLPLEREALDIRDAAAVSTTLDALSPEVIINAAAYTAVDAAESHEAEAFALNGDGVRHLAQWAAGRQARLIHVSTDFVFDGRQHRPYRVDDAVAPLSVYGKSKLAGEQALTHLLPECGVILRTAWLYSPYRQNFVKTMLRLMRERESLGVVDDQVGTPTSTAGLVSCLQALVEAGHARGVYHWTDAGVASWYDFAVAIQEEALALGVLDNAIPIRPIATEQYPTPAVRPSYSVLDKSRALEELHCPQVHWRVALRDVLKHLSEF
ncbi:MAG: dTDP-4-dehydrorhamnose reductase [Pseudomonadales bacterium]|nr:dTDP-4-dehydrorhamnose reductase [Pseudomonadales bacterium]MCP5330251.1 dTDP-4-dehydrorhamnose reductase [Pseudomonadales bacterium]MCP5344132.1 dTDP-4-dehydrorhamnose reductase [Pseudomonadales bacterium]